MVIDSLKRQLSVTREKMYSDIAVAMGGRIAEEIIFGHDKGHLEHLQT